MLEFSWDLENAASNERKHGITFDEARTVFGDTLSVDIDDPGHSGNERRYVIIGRSDRERIIVVVYSELNLGRFASSVPEPRSRVKDDRMNDLDGPDPDMLDDYDFSVGRRGRYARHYAQGPNYVVLDPERVAFRDSREVNEALREPIELRKKAR